MTFDYTLLHQDYQPRHIEDFKASEIDPELIDLNIRSVDLSWSSKYRGGEEIENEDIFLILESLNWTVTRLANGRINRPLA